MFAVGAEGLILRYSRYELACCGCGRKRRNVTAYRRCDHVCTRQADRRRVSIIFQFVLLAHVINRAVMRCSWFSVCHGSACPVPPTVPVPARRLVKSFMVLTPTVAGDRTPLPVEHETKPDSGDGAVVIYKAFAVPVEQPHHQETVLGTRHGKTVIQTHIALARAQVAAH